MQIAIPIYDGVTALDAVGPYEPLSRVPGMDVRFVGVNAGPVRCDTDALSLVADNSVDDVPSPDMIVVPGGEGSRRESGDALLDWIRSVHKTTKWTTSVCTGSLLLGKAGLLDGLKATSHWIYLDMLREYGAEPTVERVVEQGKIVTAAGVSSGIDMALRLIQLEGGDELAPGDPALDRVRPAASGRRRLAREGPGPPRRAGAVGRTPAAGRRLSRGDR